MTTKLAVLFSGGGRTVLNILDHSEQVTLDAEICIAIASRSGIAGIDLLADRGLDVAIARQQGEDPRHGDSRIDAWLDEARPDLVCLCGYLRLLAIPTWMQGRVLNIHPALLPKYGGKGMYGLHVHETVINNKETESGCTVHFVDEEYDHGPNILQLTCKVFQGDSPQLLADRVFALEREAYPKAIQEVVTQQKV